MPPMDTILFTFLACPQSTISRTIEYIAGTGTATSEITAIRFWFP
jgi:hypothetical protein